MADESRPRLGRGLAALIGDVGDDGAMPSRAVPPRQVPIELIRPNPRNPRRTFTEADLEDLSNSIRERGVIQPIVVRVSPSLAGAYEIIAGERRWRAAQRAGLHELPVVLVEADDKTALEIAIIENVQRADLDPLEEAAGYQQLIGDYGYSQNDLAQVIGKSRSHVANTLRLLKLPDSVKELVHGGTLSAGHARALLSVADPDAIARQIVEKGLNVRDVERIAQDEAHGEVKAAVRRVRADKDADTRALEKALEDVLGIGVRIDHRGEGGELRLRYRSLEQLDALCQRLRG